MKTSLFNNDGKNAALKLKILGSCINDGDYSIADLSKELNTSIPTITKLVGELIEEGFLEDLGKQCTSGGRKPSLYGLNSSAGYIIGTDVRRHHISIAVTDFKGGIVNFQENIPFVLESTKNSFAELCSVVIEHVKSTHIPQDKILAYGFNLAGRVNTSGYCFSYFIGEGQPLTTTLEEMLGCPVFIENDSRAMAYGEYIGGCGKNEKNFLFFNVSWGLGMGMIIDGKLSYGKSGFSGEIGHFPLLDNNQICQCGKIGCIETGASGSAIHRIIIEKLKEGTSSILKQKFDEGEDISLDDILAALKEEDVLSIEVIEEIGGILGKTIAGLINIFNPETVVIGGRLSVAKDYLMLPIMSAINKYSLIMVSKDTSVVFSKLGLRAGAIGACLLSRSKLLGFL